MSARDEFDFANDARAALLARTPKAAWLQTLIIAACVFSLIGWASLATLDEVTRAGGRVIPSSQLQVVQTLEAGTVSEILVREGDMVEKGQVLMQVDDTGQTSRAGELKQKRYALLAEIARLEAEDRMVERIPVPADADGDFRTALASEQATLDSRLVQLAKEIAILRKQAEQRQQELKELEATRDKLLATMVPLERELKLTRDLNKRGFVPEIEVLRLVRQEAEVKGQIEVAAASIPRAEAAIVEAEERAVAAASLFRTEARQKLARVRNELAIMVETERDATFRVAKTQLRAPVRGIVNKVAVTTLGAVVQPGIDIISVVPIDDTLLIEARISPRDVAFIREGMPASVKLTAYDYTIYGALDGEVSRIGADTMQDSEGQAFYRVIVATRQTHVEHGGRRLPIIPGMQASVDILTGEKTVLAYLLKPVTKIRSEALTER